MVLKTIVTSIYELNYEPKRNGEVYKNIGLLTETIDALIHNRFNYVIYTDKKTSDKHSLESKYNRENVKIIFKELNSDFYLNTINPIRENVFNKIEIYDRIYTVKNYEEVIFNKLENLLEVSNNLKGNGNENQIIWLDSGLFGTSCSDGWRDYMRDMIYNKTVFLDKIFEKVSSHNFICTKGNGIEINYELRDQLNSLFNFDISIIPGCLFGGKQEYIDSILINYKEVLTKYIKKYEALISEQEVLSVLTNDKNVKFYEFDDWLDLQKAFLKIMDIYDESKYNKTTCYNYKL